MSHDLEAGAFDSVRAVFGRKPKHTLAVGAPCPNCGTALAGPWCHACGQSSEDFHRSLRRLAAEALGGLVETDSRLWRTLPDLIRNPGRLTRAYLEGHRAPQAPPFRMFLIVVLAVFLVAGLGSGVTSRIEVGAGGSGGNLIVSLNPTTKVVFKFLTARDTAAGRWFTERLRRAAPRAEAVQADLGEWAEHLAILALPISAALMGAMFFWRRGVYMFDHLIFSMHSLTFQGILLTAAIIGAKVTDWAWWLLIVAPVHLFMHLKGTYHLGIVGTLLRMLGLFIGSAIGFMVILVSLVMASIYMAGA